MEKMEDINGRSEKNLWGAIIQSQNFKSPLKEWKFSIKRENYD